MSTLLLLLLRRPPSRVLPTRAAHGHPGLLGEDSAYSGQFSPLIGWVSSVVGSTSASPMWRRPGRPWPAGGPAIGRTTFRRGSRAWGRAPGPQWAPKPQPFDQTPVLRYPQPCV
eukprot:1180906-Prorocentrum_minimum.AAC.4